MNNRKFGLGRRIAAVAAATALGVFGVAGVAHADDSSTPSDSSVGTSVSVPKARPAMAMP
jgi:hypothetical protein